MLGSGGPDLASIKGAHLLLSSYTPPGPTQASSPPPLQTPAPSSSATPAFPDPSVQLAGFRALRVDPLQPLSLPLTLPSELLSLSWIARPGGPGVKS